MDRRSLENVSRAVALGLALALSAPSAVRAGAHDHADAAVIGDGPIASLAVFPAQVAIRGSDRAARVAVTAVCTNGGVADVTRQCTFVSDDTGIAAVDTTGVVTPLKDGATRLRIALRGERPLEVAVPVTVVDAGVELPIHFANDIVPVFSKHGCNSGGCHGKSGGQNGFRLSLFGYVAEVDYASLTQESRGRRVFPAAPEHSLLLRKATGILPHGGGQRFAADSADYKLLYRWMRSGMPFGEATDPVVTAISVFPTARALARRARQQLVVTAHFSDGRTEDVTARAQYSAGDPDYLEVDAAGLVSSRDAAGQGTVLVRYKGLIALFRATVPSGADVAGLAWPEPRNFIDDHVFRRLRTLGIQPSALCTDAEFLRRASVDIAGTLPGSAETAAFLADTDPARRERLVDRLLERTEHARYFALLWADLLRNRRGGEERATPITIGFHGWLLDAFLENRPYDRLVRELLCAEGGVTDNPAVAWYRELDNPKKLVDDTAQVFLGTRIQCARCHHHPFEKWGQEDYWHLVTFFSRVDRRNDDNSRSFAVSLRRGDCRFTDDEPTSASHKKTYVGLRLLGGQPVEESQDADPREALVEWMVRPENPLFAAAAVNRYWKHFFGRGIVEPEDDLRDTNPPTNPELLEALAQDFREHGHDLRHLARTIARSATYQLSSVPTPTNQGDRQSFSRYQPRRLEAEVLLDALDQVTGRKTRFQGTLREARAIDLHDETSRNYFLEVFGKPERSSACACERSGDVTLPQTIHLLNSRETQDKLASDEGRAAALARDARPLEERVRELFLLALTRPPTGDEVARAAVHLEPFEGERKDAGERRRAWEDLLWALVNTKEFLFVH